MAKFKLVYNKVNKDGKLNGSYTGIPGVKDKEITVANLEGAKLVYLDDSAEKKTIKASKTGIPTKEDLVVCSLEALEETGDTPEAKTQDVSTQATEEKAEEAKAVESEVKAAKKVTKK